MEFGRNKVIYIAKSLDLYKIKNKSEIEYTVSLYLYTLPNTAVRGYKVFDRESGVARHVI